MSYSVEIDKEILVSNKIYSVFVSADLEYSNSEDPECSSVEIAKAEVSLIDGNPMEIDYEGRRLEKVVVVNHPALTDAIDEALWDAIQTYTEDNYRDLIRDFAEAYDDRDL